MLMKNLLNVVSITIDVHTAFLHADVDQDLFARTGQNQMNGMMQD